MKQLIFYACYIDRESPPAALSVLHLTPMMSLVARTNLRLFQLEESGGVLLLENNTCSSCLCSGQ